MLALPLLAAALAASPAATGMDGRAFSERCGRGFAADCRELGRAHLGEAPARDDRLAAARLTQACELGDPAACSDLGVLYAVGRGLPQSDERALALSRRACEQGAAVACSNQGALLAEGVGAGPQAAPGEAGASALRLFRAACDAGVPEGCANLGTAHEGGRLAVRDVKAAARALRRACDAELALACQRLALLLRERPDVAPDLAAPALDARACQAGIAPSCYAAGATTPLPSARTPAARLVDDPRGFVLGIPGAGGFSPGELASRPAAGGRRRVLAELRSPPGALQAAVPAELRGRLGVDGPAAPRAGGDPAVEILLALRAPLLGQCYEAPRVKAAAADEAFAVLFVDGDGRPSDVRAASRAGDATLEECVREIVEGWEFPSSDEGYSGPFLVRRAFDAAPGPAAGYAGPGYLRPAPREPGCVQRALRVPPEYRASTGAVSVKLAVDAAGRPGLFHPIVPVPDEIVSAIAAAARACRWSAGGDADGRPLPLWTVLTVELDPR